MSSPLSALTLPTTTIVMPTKTESQFFTVTAGPRRGHDTISIPVGASQIIIDWNIPSGSLYLRTRFYLNANLSFPIGYTTLTGVGTMHLRMVNDDSSGWLAIQGTAVAAAVNTARVGVTIFPIAAA